MGGKLLESPERFRGKKRLSHEDSEMLEKFLAQNYGFLGLKTFIGIRQSSLESRFLVYGGARSGSH